MSFSMFEPKRSMLAGSKESVDIDLVASKTKKGNKAYDALLIRVPVNRMLAMGWVAGDRVQLGVDWDGGRLMLKAVRGDVPGWKLLPMSGKPADRGRACRCYVRIGIRMAGGLLEALDLPTSGVRVSAGSEEPDALIFTPLCWRAASPDVQKMASRARERLHGPDWSSLGDIASGVE